MPDKPNLSNAYALRTPADSRALYADWAETYDTSFRDDTGYVLHQMVAEAFAKAGGRGPVLDLGAGTGAVAEVLAALKVGPISGTDISPEMLMIAAEKNLYSDLFEGDILAGLPRDPDSFAGIVSAGTFTLGHVGPEGLDEVIRLLAPGGLAVISVRDAHYEAAGFSDKIALLEPVLRRSTQAIAPVYAPGSLAEHKHDKAILLHLWKA